MSNRRYRAACDIVGLARLLKHFTALQLTGARSKTAERAATGAHSTHLQSGVRISTGLALRRTLLDGQLRQRHLRPVNVRRRW